MSQADGNVEHSRVPAEARGAARPVVASEVGASLPQPVFYKTDATKVSFTEFTWEGSWLLAALGWFLVKCCRLRIPGSTDDLAVESLNAFEVAPAALPVPVRQRLATLARELATAGFRSPICHCIDDVHQSTTTYLVTMAHATLPVVARLHNRICTRRTPPKNVLFTEFITAYTNGEFLWSLSSKPDMLAPPSCRIVREEGAAPLELWNLHQQQLAEQPSGGRAIPVAHRAQVRAVCNRLHAAVRDFHLERGVFVPLTPKEEQNLASTRQARQQVQAGGTQYPEILAELERQQKQRTGWRGAILMLAVSILVFIVVGLPGQPFSLRLLMLVPVLLFHECGHYVAMRASGYRNLRMFFIPGFGAAVSGQHFNVPGWKKAIVSLMGPVPGILVGIALSVWGLISGRPLVLEAALLMLILNGFNLLPVLPLDGGHVIHTVLFSRHYVLDVLFRLSAAILLAIVAGWSGDRFLLIVAALMLIGLPQAVLVAKAARELRQEGLEPASPDSQTIAPVVAERIIAKLQFGAKKPKANKFVAQMVLQIFETLNTRPPGWAASGGLMFVHGMSFVAAVFFSLLVVFAQHGGIGDYLRAGAQGPRHAVVAAAVREARPAATAAKRENPCKTIVATFARTPQALAAYEDVSARLQPDEAAALLGDSLLIRVPPDDDEARQRWLTELQPRAADVFVDGGAMRAHFRFSAIARDEAAAQAITEELQNYFRLPISEGIAAPWSLSTVLTPDQQRARKTYLRLQSSNYYDDPEAVELRDQLSKAQRRGDTAEAKTLSERLRQSYIDLERKRLRQIAEDESPDVDTELARRYVALQEELKPVKFYQTVGHELAPRLGLASSSGEDSDAAGDTTWARSGYATRVARVIQIQFVSFFDPAAGAPGVIKWLSDKGCQTLHYDVSGQAEEDEPEDQEADDERQISD